MTQPINVNPPQCAQWALEFLRTAHLTGDDAERFGITRALLIAISTGTLVVTTPPPPSVASGDAHAVEPDTSITQLPSVQ